MKIKIRLDNGKIIERVPTFNSFGNFQQMTIRYKNEEYLVGDGDEYIRGGYEEIFDLDLCRKLKKWKLQGFCPVIYFSFYYFYDTIKEIIKGGSLLWIF